jgi:hypothetical protein
MRLFAVLALLLGIASPAAAQFAGMPGCTGGACADGNTYHGNLDYENIRAYLAALSTAGAHANGANCSAGQYPLGVTAGNAVESCTVDDDVPEAGDFGALALTGACTSSGLTTSLAAGSVGASQIATGALTAADAAADLATQAELDAKSAATSTDNAIARFDSTAGDVQNSGVLIDDSNNVTVPGTLTAGTGTGPSCLILRNSADSGNVSCRVVSTTFTCEVDTNGVCGDGT